MICNYLDALGTCLDLHSTTYEKLLILNNFYVDRNRGSAYKSFRRYLQSYKPYQTTHTSQKSKQSYKYWFDYI